MTQIPSTQDALRQELEDAEKAIKAVDARSSMSRSHVQRGFDRQDRERLMRDAARLRKQINEKENQ